MLAGISRVTAAAPFPQFLQPSFDLRFKPAVDRFVVRFLDTEVILVDPTVGCVVGVLVAFAFAEPFRAAVVGIQPAFSRERFIPRVL